MSLLTVPNVFTDGTGPANIIDAVQMNANFTAVATAVNNIYPSQVLPITTAQATFGGSIPYIFPNGLTASAPITASQTNLIATGLASFSTPAVGVLAGDLVVQRTAQAGGVIFGGATLTGVLAFSPSGWVFQNPNSSNISAIIGGATTGTQLFSLGTTISPLTVNMIASQSVPGLLINGASSISGNLLEVDLTSGGTKALVVNSVGVLQLGGNAQGLVNGDFAFGNAAAQARMWWGTSSTTSGFMDFGLTNSGQYSFQADPSALGYVIINATSLTTHSDVRDKQNIAPVTDGLTTALQLKPCSWNWKKGGMTGMGFVAQEVEPLLPSITRTDNNGSKGLDHGGILAVAIHAIQELTAEFRSYQAAHP